MAFDDPAASHDQGLPGQHPFDAAQGRVPSARELKLQESVPRVLVQRPGDTIPEPRIVVGSEAKTKAVGVSRVVERF
jgi:hypothetical protein